jgi:hypothetical protein
MSQLGSGQPLSAKASEELGAFLPRLELIAEDPRAAPALESMGFASRKLPNVIEGIRGAVRDRRISLDDLADLCQLLSILCALGGAAPPPWSVLFPTACGLMTLLGCREVRRRVKKEAGL